jgi:hypothetical protein
MIERDKKGWGVNKSMNRKKTGALVLTSLAAIISVGNLCHALYTSPKINKAKAEAINAWRTATTREKENRAIDEFNRYNLRHNWGYEAVGGSFMLLWAADSLYKRDGNR